MGHWKATYQYSGYNEWVREDNGLDDPVCPHCGNADLRKMEQRANYVSLTMTFCRACHGEFDAAKVEQAKKRCPVCGHEVHSPISVPGWYYCENCGQYVNPEKGLKDGDAGGGEPWSTACPLCGASDTIAGERKPGMYFCRDCRCWFNAQNRRFTWNVYTSLESGQEAPDEPGAPDEPEGDWRDVWRKAWT